MKEIVAPWVRSITLRPSFEAEFWLTRVWSRRTVAMASSPTSHGVVGQTSAVAAMNDGSR